MSLVVQKFGGTSVADADRIRAVADHVARTRRGGDQVVVVVSAMGKTTDDLVRLAADVSATQPNREVDMLLSSGERISMALLCMALADLRGGRPLLHRQPGRDHHRRGPHPGQDRGDPGRPAAETLAAVGCRWWPGSRGCPTTGT